jgi:hypothetical protein
MKTHINATHACLIAKRKVETNYLMLQQSNLIQITIDNQERKGLHHPNL